MYANMYGLCTVSILYTSHIPRYMMGGWCVDKTIHCNYKTINCRCDRPSFPIEDYMAELIF